ncbi:ABC-type multidrug transport system, ATPase and permease component [Hyella patelloides LEGE 07179]|uniref:ABC-type multidrug transport system, ATPase and permease component n=1 Tax=Hyella patelloides LEGE 07179 TaxID=945734 RepID=A0A563VQP9_9CYAN|nr:ABC transporter ATP-binding protein [Hyella patelloides]VEP13709.1 ABC-type multidrug transport system, ATPase and permease component [Hyella patelloides LEGE 07179]
MTKKKHPLLRLSRYGRKYRVLIWQAAICSVLNKLFDLAPPALIGAAVDVVIKQDNSIIAQFGITDTFQQLLIICIISAIVWGLESAFEYTLEKLWRNLAQSIQHNLRLNAYSHVQDLELAYFEDRSTGTLLSILNDDINQLERFLDVGANEIIQVLTTVIIIGGAYIIMVPEFAWMAILPIPFILWGSISFQKKLAPRYADVRDKVSVLNSRLANNLSGITTIKSFTTEAYEIERLRIESENYRQSNRSAIAFSAAFIPLIRMIILLGFNGILLYGGMEVINGNLAVGTYSVLVFLTQRLLWPLTRLGQTLDLYQRAMASINRAMDLLDTPITIHSGNLSLPTSNIKGEIQLKNITFAYNERQPVIENLSLNIPAGDTVAIVGSTGSGKSTLVKLLLRFYETNLGTITLDGIDIKDIDLTNLRQSMGLVSQDVFLFHGTVKDNIVYGNNTATEIEIIKAAQIAEAHEFISNLPQGYATIVGERGQKLSGGQRQRIAIARAVLKNPPILILDEATSAVDNETEAAIARSLEKITRNRTTIAIAHRLSTIRHADCIYVLEYGKIVEQGTHEQLLAKAGVYNNLWQVQTGVRVNI